MLGAGGVLGARLCNEFETDEQEPVEDDDWTLHSEGDRDKSRLTPIIAASSMRPGLLGGAVRGHRACLCSWYGCNPSHPFQQQRCQPLSHAWPTSAFIHPFLQLKPKQRASLASVSASPLGKSSLGRGAD